MKNIIILFAVVLLSFASCDTKDVSKDPFDVADLYLGTMDDEIALINNEIPSFGGFFEDENGQLVSYLVEDIHKMSLSKKDKIKSDIIEAYGKIFGEENNKVTTVQLVQGQYTYKQLNRWKNIVRKEFSYQKDGMVTLDIDEVKNKMYIGLASEGQQIGFATKLNQLGIETEAFEFKVENLRSEQAYKSNTQECSAGVFAVSLRCSMLDFAQGKYVGGLRYSFVDDGQGGSCSIGFNVEYNGKKGFITASHCGKIAQKTGFEIFQQDNPPFLSNYKIAYELIDPGSVQQIARDAETWTFQRYTQYWTSTNYDTNRRGDTWWCGDSLTPRGACRFSDAMLAEYQTVALPKVEVGYIAKPLNGGGFVIDTFEMLKGYRISKIVTWPRVNEIVSSIGATTGQTNGTISRVCVDVTTTANNRFLCQSRVRITNINAYTTRPGDSGGPVFQRLNPVSSSSVENVSLYGVTNSALVDGYFNFSPVIQIIGKGATRSGERPNCSHTRSEICSALNRVQMEVRATAFR